MMSTARDRLVGWAIVAAGFAVIAAFVGAFVWAGMHGVFDSDPEPPVSPERYDDRMYDYDDRDMCSARHGC